MTPRRDEKIKSFLFETLLHFVRCRGEIAVAWAWSGLVASLLPGDRICHARFDFPVPSPRDKMPWNITARNGKDQVLIRSKFLLWDEVGTISAAAADVADACLRDLCKIDIPLGGKLVVLGGDLRQTLPINEFADGAEVVANAVAHSAFWPVAILTFCKYASCH